MMSIAKNPKLISLKSTPTPLPPTHPTPSSALSVTVYVFANCKSCIDKRIRQFKINCFDINFGFFAMFINFAQLFSDFINWPHKGFSLAYRHL